MCWLLAALAKVKVSLIARLIATAGLAQTPHHFIALTPGRDYQLELLRSVVAQLNLKHNLVSAYFPSDSYPALRLEFAHMVQDLSARGIAETIYLDGLDQLQPELDGSRDITFLPLQLPPGIVIVLGSRPNESTESLALSHGVRYSVPPLADADAITRWQLLQPQLDHDLLQQLARTINGNALLVELAATLIAQQSHTALVPLLEQSIADATNLFRLSLARMQAQAASEWQTIARPSLAVLLVTQEPLAPALLAAIIEQPADEVAAIGPMLADWVSAAADQRLSLRHLLFHDYLLQHESSVAELREWHGRMALWCGAALGDIWQTSTEPIEQTRRWYGQQHYITHLALAEMWSDLWQVVDAGDYGAQKIHFEPSTRLYGLDLDRARESVIAAGQSLEQQLELLPRLWRYSLLRTSLTSHADQWHANVFVILAVVGRVSEALAQIDICSDAARQVQLWSLVLPYVEPHRRLSILQRMEQVARSIHDQAERDYALYRLALAYADSGMIKMADGLALVLTEDRDEILAYVVEALINQHDLMQALGMVAQIQASKYRFKTALLLANALLLVEEFTKARQVLTEALPFAYSEHIVELTARLATIEWQLGNYQQAQALLIKAHVRSERLSSEAQILALPAVVKCYLAQGNLAKARSLQTAIDSDRFRRELVLIYIEHGDIATSVELAATITHWHSSDPAYVAIAAWYCKNAKLDQAQQVIELIIGHAEKVESYCLLASSYTQHSQIEQLLKSLQLTITQSNQTYYAAENLLRIADTYAGKSMHNQAKSVFAEALTTILNSAQSSSIMNDHMDRLLLIAQRAKHYGYANLYDRIGQIAFLISQQEAFVYSLVFEKAKIYLNHGDIGSVRQIIEQSAEPQLAVKLLQMLATRAIDQQDYSQVQSYLLAALPYAQAADSITRIRLLCELAAIALHSGFKALGKTMLGEATQLLPTIESATRQSWTGLELVRSYHTYGLLTETGTIVKAMATLESQQYIIKEICICHAANGEIDQAYTALKSANLQAEQYQWNLYQIVIKAHELGLAERTLAYWAEAIAVCNLVTDPIYRLKHIKELALTQIHYGSNHYFSELLDSIRTIQYPGLKEYQYVEVLCEIARAFAKQGDYPEFIDWLTYAHTIAQSIVIESRPKVVAYHYIAMAYITHATDADTQAFLAELLRFAEDIKPSSYADDLFNNLTGTCTHYAVRGNPEFFAKAYQFAIRISVPLQRASALREVANGYAEVDDRVGLQTLIIEISQIEPDLGLETSAMIYAKRGDLAFAQVLIATGEPWEEKDFVLEYLVSALLQTNDPLSAYRLVPNFDSVGKRVESLQQIVAYYAERQQLAASIKLIQTTWRNCAAADELWELRAIVLPLDSAYPGLALTLLDGMPWVEQQLERYG